MGKFNWMAFLCGLNAGLMLHNISVEHYFMALFSAVVSVLAFIAGRK